MKQAIGFILFMAVNILALATYIMDLSMLRHISDVRSILKDTIVGGGGGQQQQLSWAGTNSSDVDGHKVILPKQPKQGILKGTLVGGGGGGQSSSAGTNTSDITISSNIGGHNKAIQSKQPQYTLKNVLSTMSLYDKGVGVFVYHPKRDSFVVYCPKYVDNGEPWDTKRHEGKIWDRPRLLEISKYLTQDLRKLFPERINAKSSDELAFAVAWGDYPFFGNYTKVLHHHNTEKKRGDEFAPVLQFGAVFNTTSVPMIPMPMPESPHLTCFHKWVMTKEICDNFLPRSAKNKVGLVFNEGKAWDELTPQVVWRGSDFPYLPRLGQNNERPTFSLDNLADYDVNGTVLHIIKEMYDQLTPRWQGVVLGAEAEREARNNHAHNKTTTGSSQKLPFANIKFPFSVTHKPTNEDESFIQFQRHGINAIGEVMSLEDLAEYRYQLDLGGVGGTTWLGTFQKLAMPGLLFHHETPTKDYIHDVMKRWVHYVPVKSDLSDLKERYEWAESHPNEARGIANEATALMKSFGDRSSFASIFKMYYRQPLGEVAKSYQPLMNSSSWREVIKQSGLRPVLKCKGLGQPCEEQNGLV